MFTLRKIRECTRIDETRQEDLDGDGGGGGGVRVQMSVVS